MDIAHLFPLTLAKAYERTEWYACRWLAEDYHQCLKTGCAIKRGSATALSSEKRQLQEGERLLRLLGFLAPIAARLLQLREIARLTPKRLAMAEIPKELVKLVAVLAEVSCCFDNHSESPVETTKKVPPDSLTVGDFWRHVACFGGYLGRRRAHPAF